MQLTEYNMTPPVGGYADKISYATSTVKEEPGIIYPDPRTHLEPSYGITRPPCSLNKSIHCHVFSDIICTSVYISIDKLSYQSVLILLLHLLFTTFAHAVYSGDACRLCAHGNDFCPTQYTITQKGHSLAN